ADAADIECRLRRLRHLKVGDLRDRAAQRVDWVGEPEGTEAVAARPLERHAVPMAADGDACEAQTSAVDRHEAIDRILQRVVEQLPRATEIAEPFLADVRDERDRAGRAYVRLL